MREIMENYSDLEQVYSIDSIDDIYDFSMDDLEQYKADPVVRKYATKTVYNKLLNSNAVLEMISQDFGDGHGDPVGYLFGKRGKVGYIRLTPNNYSYSANIDFETFKKIVEGEDLFWQEMGFGSFDSAEHYLFEPVRNVNQIIRQCEKEDRVFLNNRLMAN